MDIPRTRILAGLVATLAACAMPATVSAANYIDMGSAPLLGAYDQPFVRIEISDADTPLGPSSATNQFLLDTGATSILAVGGAAADLRRSSGDFTQGEFLEQGVGGFISYQVSAPYTVNVLGGGRATLAAGDANEDLSFDQLDIVQVLQRGKYLTGQFADWGGGDWAQATDGYPGSPAEGDGRFDQMDIVAALQHGLYKQGPYATQTEGVGGISNYDVRVLSDPAQSFGGGLAGFEGIVGMPAMVNRVTTLDMASSGGDGLSNIDLNDLDALIGLLSSSSVSSGIGVSFSHAMPASNGHRYGIPARALHFDQDESGPVPTAAPLPVVTANHHLDGRTVTGDSYIIDTGAQMSFMSLDKARGLGLDPNDPFTTLAIAGVGGTTDVPVFYVESLSLTTNEGVELYWRDVQVIGLDLDPSIDGVIGSDLLTAGMLETSLDAFDLDNLIAVGEGPIEKVHFDFRTLDQDTQDGTGAMYLDLNPDYDLVRDGVFDPNAGGDGGGIDDPLAGLDLSGLGLSGLDLNGLDLNGLDLNGLDDLDIFDLISDIFGLTAIPGHQAARYLGPSPDANAEGSIYEATFGSGFDSLELGEVTPVGLDEAALLNDPSVAGSLAAGGALEGLELVHIPVPEPNSLILSLLGIAGWFALRWRRRK